MIDSLEDDQSPAAAKLKQCDHLIAGISPIPVKFKENRNLTAVNNRVYVEEPDNIAFEDV